MRYLKATVAAAFLAFLLPAASFATKIPIPVEGATLNLSFQLQTQMLINENGTPDGQNPSWDVFVRRSRILVNGDINQNFSYLAQIDNANFGKGGNFTGRALLQDAWIGWAPTGITGPNVVYIDAGILLIPISRHLLESTTNFITADVHTDTFRGISATTFPGLRDTGVQLRGWVLDKKIGFRGGVYEGVRQIGAPAAGTPALNPNSLPQFAGFVNFDIIGSEEGGWLYGAYKWGKDPVVSIGGSYLYQSKALFNPLTRNLTDQQLGSVDAYLNYPMTEQAELVATFTAYFNRNGSNSQNTGLGLQGDIGYRYGFIAPYFGYEYYSADTCDSRVTAAQCVVIGQTDSRNVKAGLNFFFNKNLNHLMVEFFINHGQSANQTTSLNLTRPATHGGLLHWNVLF
jgi:hypothetical protein